MGASEWQKLDSETVGAQWTQRLYFYFSFTASRLPPGSCSLLVCPLDIPQCSLLFYPGQFSAQTPASPNNAVPNSLHSYAHTVNSQSSPQGHCVSLPKSGHSYCTNIGNPAAITDKLSALQRPSRQQANLGFP